MWLFDHLKDRHHHVWMDNLYLSAKFVKAAFMHKHKVLIAGVTRKSGRGLPASVLQEEEKNKNKQEALRGTVKVSVLKGDPDWPAMVAASVYDTKPVHFLSMMCELIQWVVKE
jgi:Transposase IS4